MAAWRVPLEHLTVRHLKIMNIAEMWIEHGQAQFPPGYGGTDVNGVCVSSLDTFATGCISYYMGHERNDIDVERYLTLQKCKLDLEHVLPHVQDEALEYFGRLHELCNSIITEAGITQQIS